MLSSSATLHILGMGDRLQVVGVHTTAVRASVATRTGVVEAVAEVIEFHFGRDLADGMHIHGSMSED